MKRNLVGKILGKIKIFVQDFVPIRTALNGLFLKNELLLKDPEGFNSRSARPCELYSLSMLKRKGLPMETVQYLGRGYRPIPDPVTAKMAFFSGEKSIPSNSTDHFDVFLKPL